MLFTSIGIWSIAPIFLDAEYGYSSLIWFIVLYLTAGYIKRYRVNEDIETESKTKNFVVAIMGMGITILIGIMCIFIGQYIMLFNNPAIFSRIAMINSPLTLLIATKIFIGFIKLKPTYNKIINVISSTTLAVYLIHDNNLMRPYLWENVVRSDATINSPYLIIQILIGVTIIFIVCIVIDLLRQLTVEKVYMKIINHFYNKSIKKDIVK